ncbi:MAG: glycosyltransferase, partial [Deltaproteobacteria bacterium]
MKIIFDGIVYSSAPSGGIYRYFNELIPRLSAFPDTEINIFTGKDAATIPGKSNIKISYDQLPTGSWLPEGGVKSLLRKGKRTLQKMLLEQKFNGVKNSVFHSTYYTPPLWKNITQVVTVYDLISELVTETYHLPHHQKLREAKQNCLKTANRVIAISETTKRDLHTVYGISEDRIDVIYLGVDFEFFSTKRDPNEQNRILNQHGLSCPFLFYLGGRLHHKNFNRFLISFAKSNASKEFKLAVAGTPWNESELKLINSLNIKSQVVWIPPLK